MSNDMDTLERRIGILFHDKRLLKEALTHRSYLNEHPEWEVPHNERLEFLGDAVLELVVTENLFARFKEYDEGRLTGVRAALVNHLMLAEVAADIGLEKHLYVSRGEAQSPKRGRQATLGNAVEALIGALYLDRGYEAAKQFVERFVLIRIPDVMREERYRDPKSLLQERVQDELQVTPTYRVLSESGPDHAKVFVVGVYFNGDFGGEGSGSSKQEAEREAAERALEHFGE